MGQAGKQYREPGRNGSCGWVSDWRTFCAARRADIFQAVSRFVPNASASQHRAWRDAIRILQQGLRHAPESAQDLSLILEYELPRQARRVDALVLGKGSLAVLEFKGKARPSRADLDQTLAYARDLRCYHRQCVTRPVHAVLVLTRAKQCYQALDGVTLVDPGRLTKALAHITQGTAAAIDVDAFLDDEAYAPLPSLVQAARHLFTQRCVPPIWRAGAATDPAVERLAAIVHRAAQTKTRRLVLLTGIPGAGKTLVGLRLVHAHFLDDLAVSRGPGCAAPAVFLSGNGPLVQVLQYALRGTGGGGRVFVQDLKNYVKTYTAKKSAVPPEHVFVFDEAQRAWDARQVALKHGSTDPARPSRSEPEHVIEFAERVPDWCVVVGLIGTGQEIHIGEEGGLQQWRRAVARAGEPGRWQVHVPPALTDVFTTGSASEVRTHPEPVLNLDAELRYHLTPQVDTFVEVLLGSEGQTQCDIPAVQLADTLFHTGHRYLITRDLEAAKAYARARYADTPEARYGLLASSKDRDLVDYGVDNTFRTTRRLHVGRWYNQPADAPDSCCALDQVATEFAAQGLELDLAIVAWGTDFVRRSGRWSIERARGFRGSVRDPFQLRQNVYRVLLTRGRDGTVIYLPPTAFVDETWAYLQQLGLRPLT